MNKKIFVALSTFAEYGDALLKLLEESGLEYFLNSLGRWIVREEVIARWAKTRPGLSLELSLTIPMF